MMPADRRPIRRALLSVSDKTGLEAFGKALAEMGVELISTGGTAQALRAAGLGVEDVAAVTGFPEMMDGRVKTLHPRIHGGLLAVRADASHREAAERHGIPMIDLLVVNLYPFEATVAKGAGFDETVENIDIGGPALIRGASKNHHDVTVIVDPSDYPLVLDEMRTQNGATLGGLRRFLAAKAYARTAAYDAAIARWLEETIAADAPPSAERHWPQRFTLAGERVQGLRYGENPHQAGAFYATDRRPGLASADQIQGKALSYNNINDADAAFELAAEFDARAGAAVAIIKHANPCGVAIAPTLAEAYEKALRCDPVSAFGGVIAVNRPLDGAAADAITRIFTEVVIAPGADEDARRIFARKKDLRLLVTRGMPDAAARSLTLRTVGGGFLVQDRDAAVLDPAALTVATQRRPTSQEEADLLFAFTVAKHVKSNAIVYAKDGATAGIGAGQMSRVDSARIAAQKAAEAAKAAGLARPLTEGSVVASDAFFPFPDGLIACVEAGATAVIQPGGSIRDAEVIAAADGRGLAMVLTGMRHFRH